eukprot:2912966-Alexandrium_andersonii.AAC.1
MCIRDRPCCQGNDGEFSAAEPGDPLAVRARFAHSDMWCNKQPRFTKGLFSLLDWVCDPSSGAQAVARRCPSPSKDNPAVSLKPGGSG